MIVCTTAWQLTIIVLCTFSHKKLNSATLLSLKRIICQAFIKFHVKLYKEKDLFSVERPFCFHSVNCVIQWYCVIVWDCDPAVTVSLCCKQSPRAWCSQLVLYLAAELWHVSYLWGFGVASSVSGSTRLVCCASEETYTSNIQRVWL